MGMFLGSCTAPTNPDPSSSQNATVYGHISYLDGSPGMLLSLDLAGMDRHAVSDTLGNFIFSDLQKGEYLLLVADSLVPFSVGPADTLILPDIKIFSEILSPLTIAFREGNSTSSEFNTTEVDRHTSRVILAADTIWISCSVLAPLALQQTQTITITQNRRELFHGIPEKGRVFHTPLAPSGNDTIAVFVDEFPYQSVVLLDSQQVAASVVSFISLWCGSSMLIDYGAYPSLDYMESGYSSGVVFPPDTFRIYYFTRSTVDWDLFLVNAGDDSCCWHNRNPDWGIPGDMYDNPSFRGDETSLGTWQDLAGHTHSSYYSSDHIYCDQLPAGTYRVAVRLHSLPPDSASATPTLTMELGVNPDSYYTEHFVEISACRAMLPGETWIVGTISSPDMAFTPLDSTIIAIGGVS